jgi:hypothetical protein
MDDIARDPDVTVAGQWVVFFQALQRACTARIGTRREASFGALLQPAADELFAGLTSDRTVQEVGRDVWMEDDIEPTAEGLLASEMRFFTAWAEEVDASDVAKLDHLLDGGAAIARALPKGVQLPPGVTRTLHVLQGMLRVIRGV